MMVKYIYGQWNIKFMQTFFLLLLFPLCWPLIAKLLWHNKINITEIIVSISVVTIFVSITYFSGLYLATQDVEIWNGKVVSKERIHDTYEESYSCNCTTDSEGNSSCDTCYETHYTVKWIGNTTVGDVTFDYIDSTSRSVYSTPDPDTYIRCKIDEPASIEHNFINYIKAVPESLFNNSNLELENEVNIPTYPIVYDFYRIDRVINVGTNIPNDIIKELDSKLDTILTELGSMKQANIIVIFANTTDNNYKYMLEQKWLGGKKNDIIVIFGMKEYPNILWVDVITWAKNIGNEMFHVVLRDSLSENKNFEVDKVVKIIYDTTLTKFTRPSMKDFEYLKNEIEPNLWVIILCSILSIVGTLSISWVTIKHEFEDVIGLFFKDIVKKLNKR